MCKNSCMHSMPMTNFFTYCTIACGQFFYVLMRNYAYKLYFNIPIILHFWFKPFLFSRFFSLLHRQNFVVVLHAVNQYPIDIFLKLEAVHGTDHVYDVAFACRHWTVNRLAFCASAKSTVKLITQSKTRSRFFRLILFDLHLHMYRSYECVHTQSTILIVFIWTTTHECNMAVKIAKNRLVDRPFKWKIHAMHAESSHCFRVCARSIFSNQQTSKEATRLFDRYTYPNAQHYIVTVISHVLKSSFICPIRCLPTNLLNVVCVAIVRQPHRLYCIY